MTSDDGLETLSTNLFCKSFSPLKCIGQLGQWQPRLIVHTKLVEPESVVLHAKFQDRTSGSVIEFPYRHCIHLGQVTKTIFRSY